MGQGSSSGRARQRLPKPVTAAPGSVAAPALAAGTRLITRTGAPAVEDLADGAPIDVWTSDGWVSVEVIAVGSAPVWRVRLSDGAVLGVSAAVGWPRLGGREPKSPSSSSEGSPPPSLFGGSTPNLLRIALDSAAAAPRRTDSEPAWVLAQVDSHRVEPVRARRARRALQSTHRTAFGGSLPRLRRPRSPPAADIERAKFVAIVAGPEGPLSPGDRLARLAPPALAGDEDRSVLAELARLGAKFAAGDLSCAKLARAACGSGRTPGPGLAGLRALTNAIADPDLPGLAGGGDGLAAVQVALCRAGVARSHLGAARLAVDTRCWAVPWAQKLRTTHQTVVEIARAPATATYRLRPLGGAAAGAGAAVAAGTAAVRLW